MSTYQSPFFRSATCAGVSVALPLIGLETSSADKIGGAVWPDFAGPCEPRRGRRSRRVPGRSACRSAAARRCRGRPGSRRLPWRRSAALARLVSRAENPRCGACRAGDERQRRDHDGGPFPTHRLLLFLAGSRQGRSLPPTPRRSIIFVRRAPIPSMVASRSPGSQGCGAVTAVELRCHRGGHATAATRGTGDAGSGPTLLGVPQLQPRGPPLGATAAPRAGGLAVPATTGRAATPGGPAPRASDRLS